jgi:hypothetical protein
MASNLSKRLDKLERLLKEKNKTNLSPIYCSDSHQPEGVDSSRLVVIKRNYVEPAQREKEEGQEL